MIVLDTNVLSELMKAEPDKAVFTWVASFPAESLFTTTITEAEIYYGLALLPLGKRRNDFEQVIANMFREDLSGRVLPFDSSAAHAYSRIAANRHQMGRPISQFDAQIAAIAFSRGAGIATRNAADFDECEIEIINPWES